MSVDLAAAESAPAGAATVVGSLRDFLDLLEREGQVVRWSRPVALEPEVREISVAAAVDRASGPAVLLDNLRGYPGARIALNVHGSFANVGLVLGHRERGMPLRALVEDLAGRWRAQPGQLEHVATAQAPVHAHRVETDINLYRLLPLYRINAYDGGCYIAKASLVSRDPEDPDDFGKQNVGIYRVQVHGPDRLSVMAAKSHDMARHIRSAERHGLPLRIAVMIGNHPALTLFGGTPLGYDESEYAYAAGVIGHPLRLTESGNGVDVLADSELIIEAELLPGERVVEGPFGEFPGTYTGACRAPLFRVTAVSHRDDPIFESIQLGAQWGEVDTLVGLNTCVPLLVDLRQQFPEVASVNALYQHGLTCIISVRNRYGGFAKSVAHRALGSAHGLQYLKNIILVDEDVDPFDLERVMWSLSTRTRASDVTLLEDMPLIHLDPSAVRPGKGHRLIIDATRPTAPDPVARGRLIDGPEPARLAALVAELGRLRSERR